MKVIQPEAHILPMGDDILKHVERCGRIAYKSEDAITEDSYIRFIQNIIMRGHESVLEHGNYVFELHELDYRETVMIYNSLNFDSYKDDGYSGRLRFSKYTGRPLVSGNIRAWRDFIRVCQLDVMMIPSWVHETFYDNAAFFDLELIKEGISEYMYYPLQREDLTPEEQLVHWTETSHIICSRAISHEFVRHRALSPTQESQRFCNYSKGKFGGEITFIMPLWAKENGAQRVKWMASMKDRESVYMERLEDGLQAQEAREELPNSTKTELVMTGTIGEWKHFFSLRDANDAHPEARRIAAPLRAEFAEKYAF